MDSSDRERTIQIVYHHEEGSWWAESYDLPSLFAGGDSLDEAKGLARQVVSDELGENVGISTFTSR